ncbi:MAG TPA: hypothetical protein VF591_08415 [Pyrinomonadaceae bacterium]|jgi:hypothetical protein
MSERALDRQSPDAAVAPDQLELIEEFSIMELEQRLEFEAWCNFGCDSCSPPPPAPNYECPTNTGCEAVE